MSETTASGVPEDEREALLTIARGAVVTSGGVSAQRVLITATEYLLARGLGPVAYGVYRRSRRLPRGRPEIGDFRDHENRRFSNDLTPGLKPTTPNLYYD